MNKSHTNIKRYLHWFFVNITLIVSTTGGFILDIDGLRNISLALIWLNFIVSLSLLDEDNRKIYINKKLPIPVWFHTPIKAYVLTVLVFYGYFITAFANFFYILIVGMINNKSDGSEKVQP